MVTHGITKKLHFPGKSQLISEIYLRCYVKVNHVLMSQLIFIKKILFFFFLMLDIEVFLGGWHPLSGTFVSNRLIHILVVTNFAKNGIVW